MKFDKFPYAGRPKSEVFIMDWLVPAIALIALGGMLYAIFLAWWAWRGVKR